MQYLENRFDERPNRRNVGGSLWPARRRFEPSVPLVSRGADLTGGPQSLGTWRRPGASSYDVAAPSASLIQPAEIKHAASCSDISTMPSKPTVIWRFERVCTAPMPAGALTRT